MWTFKNISRMNRRLSWKALARNVVLKKIVTKKNNSKTIKKGNKNSTSHMFDANNISARNYVRHDTRWLAHPDGYQIHWKTEMSLYKNFQPKIGRKKKNIQPRPEKNNILIKMRVYANIARCCRFRDNSHVDFVTTVTCNKYAYVIYKQCIKVKFSTFTKIALNGFDGFPSHFKAFRRRQSKQSLL